MKIGKILLINPMRYNSIPVTREGRDEFVSKVRVRMPSTLLIIGSILKEKGYRVDLIDANALDLSLEEVSGCISQIKPNIVIFPLCTPIVDHDINIANISKKLNHQCVTISYSLQTKNYAKNILRKYTSLDIVIKESILSIIGPLTDCIMKEEILANIGGIAYREGPNIMESNNPAPEVDFANLPLPAYEMLKTFEPYYLYDSSLSPYADLFAGNGCPFGCKYCIAARTKYSSRKVEETVKELIILKRIYHLKYICFCDEIFTINRERTIKICEAIIKENLNIKWFCDTRVEFVDLDLLKLMKEAGCIGIAYGVESGSQKILNNMNKGSTLKEIEQALKWTRQVRIPVQLNLLLGYIGENRETIEETKNLIRKTLPEILQINIINAEPGTEFTQEAFENNWIGVGWEKQMSGDFALKNYEPFKLDLHNERRKIEKLLYCNPFWWLNCLCTSLTNRELILPFLLMQIRRLICNVQEKKLYCILAKQPLKPKTPSYQDSNN